MLTTSVLAEKAAVPVFTVRHYTRIGLLNPERQKTNGYKVYRQSDITLLRFITNAKELGFSLKEIAGILKKADHGESPCPDVREVIVERIRETRQKIKHLQLLERKMIKAKSDWEKMQNGIPDGHSVCHLIESFGN